MSEDMVLWITSTTILDASLLVNRLRIKPLLFLVPDSVKVKSTLLPASGVILTLITTGSVHLSTTKDVFQRRGASE